MLNQALDIAPLAPNVMVKVPGTREGYQVIEELTARGSPPTTLWLLRSPNLLPAWKPFKEGSPRPSKIKWIFRAGAPSSRTCPDDMGRWAI